jgi:hypothetical protein
MTTVMVRRSGSALIAVSASRAVHARHVEIHDDQVGGVVAACPAVQEVQGLLAVAGDVHPVGSVRTRGEPR